MMLSFMVMEDDREMVVLCLEAGDLLGLAHGHSIEVPLRDLQAAATIEEVGHLERVTVCILPPGSTEALLRVASESAARGRDVRIGTLGEPGGV